MNLPNVGDRISYSGHLGTVKFNGQVDNTTGTWLGVEWDEPDRGKHDGVKDGKRYFSCRVPTAGSFIRLSANVLRGVSFLTALQSKYIEAFHGTSSQERVTLGSSNGVIEVEAVNLDKIRGKFARLERLREVSLENELVAGADPPGLVMKTCPNIRGLNLSTSLLSDWLIVANIAIELPALRSLSLNRNRLRIPPQPGRMPSAFLNVTNLELNGTLTTWQEMQYITSFMPKLLVVELGYNNISRMTDNEGPASPAVHIETLNLDSNNINDWQDLGRALSHYHHLERLILTSNKIEFIPNPDEHSYRWDSLKHLSLASNALRQWKDIDALALWCPFLISFSLNGNPVTQHDDGAHHARVFTIARMPTLKTLDSTTITPKERTDCELFYLSWISQHFRFDGDPKSVAYKTALIREHPRWEELCNKHGRPATDLQPSSLHDNLNSKLIELQVLPVSSSSPTTDSTAEMVIMRVLPTMTLKMFRIKVRKQLKCPKDKNVSLWLKMNDGSWNELGAEKDQQSADWLGLENGSQLTCCIH
ncbi:hypothetical protein K435DRAFT_825160 [Dendrothele bispora CBS 962.96]|uniref:CAP-Gly domain-containing protein n=1 Tax=Dendrothele bispora (strain CBS 962.96) TaxID=1314807 RepID=A0A4S8MWS7_DENBC|nr:hypothetical protein K435DRAFT_825160 [Dendrothele bispora CBS 962.96]